jgi:iron(III) transport system substrate-binding protein
MRFVRRPLLLGAAIVAGFTAMLPAPSSAAGGEVNLYTTREQGLIQPLLDGFTKTTGIKVNTVFINAGLAERVAAEGVRSPADVLMTVDVGSLVELDDKKLTQRVTSPTIQAAMPSWFRDTSANWVPLTLRARVIVVSKDRVADKTLTYEQLADPRWKGKLCIRSGNHPYNTALWSAMIAKKGAAATEAYMTALKANLARKAAGGDRDISRDIMAGQCDLGVTNTYYIGLMLAGRGGADQKKWAEAVRVIMPTFSDGSGTHVNLSGASLARHAPNVANGTKLIEYLLSAEAQKAYAEGNFEHPVLETATLHPIVAGFGPLRVDSTSLLEIAKNRGAASQMVDRVGVDK